MCGILGIGFLEKHNLLGKEKALNSFLSILFSETRRRGRVSTGIAIASQQNIVYMKDKLSADEFIKTDEFVSLVNNNINLSDSYNRTLSIIGHCRLDTKGTPNNNLNNHPIATDDIIGAHNGVIINDDEVFAEYATSFKRAGLVDSEIIFQLVNHYYKLNYLNISNPNVSPTKDAIIAMARKLRGSMSCSLINRHDPSILYLFKVSNPLYLKCYNKLGMVVFCSDETYIDSAFKKSFPKDLDDATSIPIKQDSGIMIDVRKNCYSTFDTPTTSYSNVLY